MNHAMNVTHRPAGVPGLRVLLAALLGTCLLVGCGNDSTATATTDAPDDTSRADEPVETQATDTTQPPVPTDPPAAESDAPDSTATPESAPTTVDGDTVNGDTVGGVTVVSETATDRTIDHLDGQTTVPATPERIVSVDIADGLVAIGITPVGVSNWESTYMADVLADVANVGAQFELNYEQLAALQPDLILTHNNVDADAGYEFYALLSAIAPTVTILDPEFDFIVSQRQLGLVLGISDDADNRIVEYEARIEQAKTELASLVDDGSVALLNIRADHFRLYGVEVGYTGPFLYGQLGMTPSPFVTEYVPAGEANANISLELLPELVADHIIVLYADDLEAQWADLQTQAIWQTLPAVVAGNVYPVSSNYWYASGLIAHESKIGELTAAVAAA